MLVGDPGYYERFGFRAEHSLTYPGVPPENLLTLRLYGSDPQAEITFHVAFGAQA